MLKYVEQFMNYNVVSVKPNDNLLYSIRAMKDHCIRSLPVVDEFSRNIVGVLSESNIISFVKNNLDSYELSNEVKVKDVMSTEILFCYQKSLVSNIISTMTSLKVDTLPVIDSKSKTFIGMITVNNILDYIVSYNSIDKNNIKELPSRNKNINEYWSDYRRSI
jgi:predicted transcriptional regulator